MPDTPKPDTAGEPEITTVLRRAGYDLPAELTADLAHGHALLVRMLARLGTVPAEAEPATMFQPGAPR